MKNAPHLLPPIPPGKDFAKDSFWYKYRHRFTWKKHEAAMDWYIEQRDRAALYKRQFPPVPIFQNIAPAMPQPWNGKDEKPGRVPRK